jgi:hypothetical protein
MALLNKQCNNGGELFIALFSNSNNILKLLSWITDAVADTLCLSVAGYLQRSWIQDLDAGAL